MKQQTHDKLMILRKPCQSYILYQLLIYFHRFYQNLQLAEGEAMKNLNNLSVFYYCVSGVHFTHTK